MSPHIPTLLTRIWRYTRDEDISVRRVVVYFFLIAAIFYLLGAQYPKSDYRQLQNELKQARQENRLYADTIAKQKRAVIRESTQNRLNKKTLALLNERIDALLRENIRQKEKTLFYQQVFGNKALAGEMSIHHLEMSPDFTPQQWRLNAILVRQGKRKAFKGAYYFELVLMDGQKIICWRATNCWIWVSKTVKMLKERKMLSSHRRPPLTVKCRWQY